MAIKNTALGGTDWGAEEAINNTDLNDTIDAAVSKIQQLSAFWLNDELYDVYDDFDGEMYVEIHASSVSAVGDFSINNCTLTADGGGVWTLTSSSTSPEVQRAEIYKTLFYGTDGSNPRASATYITGITAIKTSAAIDVGKRAYYVEASINGSANVTYTGTFSDTTDNYKCSSWSYLSTNATNTEVYARWEVPSGTTLNTQGPSATGTSDETGLDLSADDVDNPTNCQLEVNANLAGRIASGRAYVLSYGSISWSLSGSATSSSLTDFYTDNSIPLLTAADTTFTRLSENWSFDEGSGDDSAITVVNSTNAGGSTNELNVKAQAGLAQSSATATIEAISLTADRHTFMKMYCQKSHSGSNGTHTQAVDVSIDGGSTWFEIFGGGQNDDENASCLTSVLVVAKGSDTYDLYLGGKKVDADVVNASFTIQIRADMTRNAGTVISQFYIDDIVQSKGTIS